MAAACLDPGEVLALSLFFFQAEDGIRDLTVTGVQTCALPIYTAEIARALGLAEVRVELLRPAAPLHDIGKIAVRDEILRKTGMLTDEERRLMNQHADVGHDLLGGSGRELLELAATIAWTHHERWDG